MMMGVVTFTGPAVYTDAEKFQKVEFADILKGKAKFAQKADNGWVAMVQHYFVAAWLPPAGAPHASSSCARSAKTSIPRA
jgi:YidC/Oxa1 family membrane protein insertase